MEDEKYWLLMSRYLSKELTLEETNELLKWIKEDPARTELLQQLQVGWDKSAFYKEQSGHFDVNRAWQKVSLSLKENDWPNGRVIRYSFWLKIAAMLLLAINIGWFLFSYYENRLPVEIVNNSNSVKFIMLPDSSPVWLNKQSKIVYKRGFAKMSKRELDLYGEAFFEVKHDANKPFIIHSSETITQVLGTSFNVKNRNETVQVSVVTGKVSFKMETEEEKVFLLPGESGIFNRLSGLQKSKNANHNFLFWKDNELSFNNERFENVIEDMENAYQVKIEVKNRSILNQRITTSFNQISVHEAMGILKTLLDCEINQSGNLYVIK